MDINPVPGNAQAGNGANNAPAVKEAAVREKSDFQAQDVKAVAKVEKPEIQVSQEERGVQFKRAAQRFFKDVFAVRDNTFSIFKDNQGQYITRITNLRDGSVSYIPEPEVLRYLSDKGIDRQALLEIQA